VLLYLLERVMLELQQLLLLEVLRAGMVPGERLLVLAPLAAG